MIIYKLTNNVNGKSYIGQSIRTLEERLYEHSKPSKGRCYAIHHAFQKYGIGSFSADIVCECDTIEELNEMEIYYIELYDTYNSGYNESCGGYGRGHFKMTDDHKQKISEALQGVVKHCKVWKVTYPSGRTYTITNMAEFCRKKGLHTGAMTEVAQGKVKQHKGYKCIHA